MAANTYACEVEFMGGPIDGHVEVLVLPLHTFVGVKVMWCTESDSFLQSLLSRLRPNPATRIAIYQIDQTRSRLCYRYLRTQLLADQSRQSAKIATGNENKDAA